jgi:16S rRNA pseudouridine516 synthase
VTVDGVPLLGNLRQKVLPEQVRIGGQPLQYLEPLNLVMYKPRGFECSRTRTDETELIYDLLPEEFYFRRPYLVPAGRLDKWASGLLILSQNGQYIHKLCSPKRRQGHPVRSYQIELIKPIRHQDVALLESGRLQLKSDEKPCLPARLRLLNQAGTLVELTLHEGRYHQIRRMLAVMDNQALSIHRTRIGELDLAQLDLLPGRWSVMTEAQIAASLKCEITQSYQPPVDPAQRAKDRALRYLQTFAPFFPHDSDDDGENFGNLSDDEPSLEDLENIGPDPGAEEEGLDPETAAARATYREGMRAPPQGPAGSRKKAGPAPTPAPLRMSRVISQDELQRMRERSRIV